MSNVQIRILTILARQGSEMRGIEIVRADEEEIVRMGNVYVHLDRLWRAGEVESRVESDEEVKARHIKNGFGGVGIRLHFYSITTNGRRRLIDSASVPNFHPNLKGA